MWKRSYGTRLGTSLAATVLAIGLAAAPSLATTAKTWTVKPGGKFSGSSSKVTFTDTVSRIEFVCESSSLSGKIESGSGLPGTHIASISAFSFGNCHGPLGENFALMTPPGSFPYFLNAESYDTAGGRTTATVTGIAGAMSGNGCTPTIAGTTPTTRGIVKGKYVNSTHELQIVTSGSTLHFYNAGAGCGIIFVNSGDHLTISGSYRVTPSQAITSP